MALAQGRIWHGFFLMAGWYGSLRLDSKAVRPEKSIRWIALGVIGSSVIGGALWLASRWAALGERSATPTTSLVPDARRSDLANGAGAETSDMLRMARAAFLACGAPEAPHDIPDGATATLEQMASAHATVKAFDEATTIYNQCVDTTAYQAGVQFRAVATNTDTETLNALQTHLHNEAIDRDQQLANRFNVQLRRYKAREKK